MTTYRAGQRVRIEWPSDGSAVEGVLDSNLKLAISKLGGYWIYVTSARAAEGTVTVLSEPRPDEPTGLGAVVEASIADWGTRRWIRTFDGNWATDAPICTVRWSDLIDPVVLSEGWTP